MKFQDQLSVALRWTALIHTSKSPRKNAGFDPFLSKTLLVEYSSNTNQTLILIPTKLLRIQKASLIAQKGIEPGVFSRALRSMNESRST